MRYETEMGAPTREALAEAMQHAAEYPGEVAMLRMRMAADELRRTAAEHGESWRPVGMLALSLSQSFHGAMPRHADTYGQAMTELHIAMRHPAAELVDAWPELREAYCTAEPYAPTPGWARIIDHVSHVNELAGAAAEAYAMLVDAAVVVWLAERARVDVVLHGEVVSLAMHTVRRAASYAQEVGA